MTESTISTIETEHTKPGLDGRPIIFRVDQESYRGPLETVVTLLRKRKLHVSDVNLAKITEDFAEYIKDSENSLPELSDFVRVMSVLLLIKTKALLPNESLGNDDEETIARFEADLVRIEVLQLLVENVNNGSNYLLHRIDNPKSVPQGFIVDSSITITRLHEIVFDISKDTKREETFAQVAVRRLANLGTTINAVERRLSSLGQVRLDELIPQDMTTPDKVVHFIAILELLKQNKIWLQQVGDKNLLQYGEIGIPSYGLKT